MRRRACLGAAAAAALSSLSACGRKPLPDGTIRLWFTYGGNNRKVLLELIDRFHREQSAVRVEATFQGDYFEGLVKLRTGLFVGATPTVTHVVGEVIPYLHRAGVLEPLEVGDLQIAPALSQQGTFSGDEGVPLVSLPFNRSTPICYYNDTLFSQLGLRPPDSWAEMREVARALVHRSGDTTERWGFECPIDWWFWVALTGQAGGHVIEDGRITLGGEAGARAIAHWQAMVHDDRSMKPPPGRDYNAWEATNNDFLAGRVAMIWTSTAFLRYLEDNARFRVKTAPLPAEVRRAVPTGGTFFVIPRGVGDAEREAGLTFLRWMMQPAQANHWAVSTGYMPVSEPGRALLEARGYYREHPNDAVTLGQLAHAMPWPWAPELFRVQREVVQPRLEEAVLARRDAGAVIAEAVRSAT